MTNGGALDPLEHVFEIRFTPNARIIDLRGRWAERISEHMHLPEWRIDDNRVDVLDSPGNVRAFVGFRSMGMHVLNSPTRQYVPDLARRFIEFVTHLEGFARPTHVGRVGVRSKFSTTFDGPFEQLLERFVGRYVSPSEGARQAIGSGAKLLDSGAPLNFADELGNFNTHCGPMTRAQFGEFFKRAEGLPEVGLYYEIDYWIKPERGMQPRELVEFVEGGATAAWSRHERIRDLILKA